MFFIVSKRAGDNNLRLLIFVIKNNTTKRTKFVDVLMLILTINQILDTHTVMLL